MSVLANVVAPNRILPGRQEGRGVGYRAAWQELITFLERRQGAATGRHPYRWDREEIYSERESRWLHADEQE